MENKIHLFTDGTGMFEAERIVPERKTEFRVSGCGIKVGKLVLDCGAFGGAKTFPIENGMTTVSGNSIAGDTILVKVVSERNKRVVKWDIGTITKMDNGDYAPQEVTSRQALLDARLDSENLRRTVETLVSDISKIKEQIKAKYIAGGTKQ